LVLRIPNKLETERLIIRPFIVDDCAAFKSFMLDREATRHLNFTEEQKTPQKAIELISEVIASYESSSPVFSLAVIEKKTGEFIGSCGFSPLKKKGEVECYYTVVRSNWGRGYATESILRLIKYGFDELNITRIVAFMSKENPASQKVAEKIGMTPCKSSRDIDLRNEKYKYSIDRDQFYAHVLE